MRTRLEYGTLAEAFRRCSRDPRRADVRGGQTSEPAKQACTRSVPVTGGCRAFLHLALHVSISKPDRCAGDERLCQLVLGGRLPLAVIQNRENLARGAINAPPPESECRFKANRLRECQYDMPCLQVLNQPHAVKRVDFQRCKLRIVGPLQRNLRDALL